MGTKDELQDITEHAMSAMAAAKRPMRPPQGATSPSQLVHFVGKQRELEQEIEKAKSAAGAPKMLLRSQLRPSPFQTRTVSKESIASLAENLKHNELTTPIVVRPIGTDLYEIVAGHCRDSAFGELGRDQIPSIVVNLTDEQAEAAVFYDNFFPAEISDYEKYLGLRQIQQRHAYSYEQLAERSGSSVTLISYLMSFSRLPDEAHTVLNKHPKLVGANLATKLAQIPKSTSKRVTQALQMLAANELKQAEVIDWINQVQAPTRAAPIVVKAGKTVFAKVLRRSGKLTIDFANEATAQSLENEITKLLRTHATAAK